MASPMKVQGGPWTEDEDNQLILLWRKGLSAAEIRNKFGGMRTRAAILGRIKRIRDNKSNPTELRVKP